MARALGGRANGGTVMLTGWAEIKTALTVPGGVTLDLTADGAGIELQDGAVLTVNGTVNARGHGGRGKDWVEGSLRIGGGGADGKADGRAVIAGTGTINLKSRGNLLNIGEKRHLTLNGVTLFGLKDNDRSLVEVNNGGWLVMKSGAITGNTRTGGEGAEGGGVDISKGTFVMEGGTISGNTASGKEGAGGGGVRVGEGSAFTMKDGEISGNTAQGGDWVYGGGVVIAWGEGGTFTMEGGAITGNTAQGGNGAAGGGVCFNGDGTFTMTGGRISENTAQGRHGGGGGVAAWGPDSMFTMTGGTISGNTANDAGGVFVNGGTFTMTGGRISGNTAANDGGGVRVGGGAFTMEGGGISGNSAAGSGGGVQVYRDWTFTKTGGIIYGGSETRSDADDRPLKNTAAKGSAVHIGSSPVKQRSATAGEDIDMDSNKPGGAGGWE
jgi:hypothetical protein